jgi:hypothetical protein
VVVKPVPPDSVVVGVPGEVVKREGEGRKAAVPDLEHGELPDVLGDALAHLTDRVEQLERRLEAGSDPSIPSPIGRSRAREPLVHVGGPSGESWSGLTRIGTIGRIEVHYPGTH